MLLCGYFEDQYPLFLSQRRGLSRYEQLREVEISVGKRESVGWD
jgi:hypothetical protein